MKVIGLTGGIGSGKSTVARLLAELGAVLIDADKVGHEAFQPGTRLHKEVVAVFGEGVLASTGEIDRKKLGEIVFGKPEALARLNQIMHPRMYEIVEEKLARLREQGVGVVVLEAPLLIEARWTPLVDETWTVVATEETVIRRLKARSNLSAEQSRARIQAQLSNEERTRYADIVIHNDGGLEELKALVNDLWRHRIKGVQG